jgi:hypothetical protein
MRTKFYSENVKGRDHAGDLLLRWEIILEWILDIKGAKL